MHDLLVHEKQAAALPTVHFGSDVVAIHLWVLFDCHDAVKGGMYYWCYAQTL